MASPNLSLLPLRSLATALFISTSASGMGNWEKTADSYFSSLVGSGGKSAVLMKPRSKVGAPGGPVSWRQWLASEQSLNLADWSAHVFLLVDNTGEEAT